MQAGILAYKDNMNNIWVWLLGLAAAAAAAGTIYFQQNEITALKKSNMLLEQKTIEQAAKLDLALRERTKLNTELEELAKKKAEVEIKYITRPVTVYRDIIKTESPDVIEATVNKEINEIFNAITTNAVNYSLRTP